MLYNGVQMAFRHLHSAFKVMVVCDPSVSLLYCESGP